jgi:hypothetical protein
VTAAHTYAAIGKFVVTVTVTDDDGGQGSATQSVTVLNMPPVIGAITGVTGPVPIGTTVHLTAPFTDSGIADRHVGTWTWDDNSTSPAVIRETGGSGEASGVHTFTSPGVYDASLVLTDDHGAAALAKVRIVVFDAAAGRIRGAGLIAPLAPGHGSSTGFGTAAFRFHAEYPCDKQGRVRGSVPAGLVELEFGQREAFRSDEFEWLVIAGSKAQLMGRGTLGRIPGYQFLLTVEDGRHGPSTDGVWIKIWETATGTVVFDNAPGSSDALDEAIAPRIAAGNVLMKRFPDNASCVDMGQDLLDPVQLALEDAQGPN